MLNPRHARLQPNAWSCSAAALRNAIACYGRRIDVRRLAKAARVTRKHGADESKIRRAARRFGYRLEHVRLDTHGLMRAAVTNLADANVPALIPVDRDVTGLWIHWITLVAADAKRVTICDSARPGPAVRVLSWRSFLGRACCYHPNETRFDLYPLRRM